MAFAGAVKTSALNWPRHRGTATAFPLAAFGLSAFFFSALGALLFPGNPSAFLMLLSWGTFGLTFIGYFFLKVYPQAYYQQFPSQRSEPTVRGRLHNTTEPDIRGVNLLVYPDFWLLFTVMAILAGTGLMTINNIGNDANALWKHYDGSVSKSFLVSNQQMHVSILSICNFVGRLLSGIGSDILTKILRVSRVWCLAAACLIFLLAQVCAVKIENPHKLGFISGLSGLGYGFLFGVFPSIVAETFGIRGLSQNWGFMTLAPVASSNVFNLLYGRIYDHHSTIKPDGNRSCDDGIECYRAAYYVTFTACIVGWIVTLYMTYQQRARQLKESHKLQEED